MFIRKFKKVLESPELPRKVMTRWHALSPLSETDDQIIGMQKGSSISQVALRPKEGWVLSNDLKS